MRLSADSIIAVFFRFVNNLQTSRRIPVYRIYMKSVRIYALIFFLFGDII